MAAPDGGCIESDDVVPAEPVPEDYAVEIRIAALQAKFKAACRQIVILDHEIRDLWRLCERAERNNKPAFWDRTNLKISVVRGVQMMFRHYANAQLAELQSVVALLGEDSSTAGNFTEGDRVHD